MKVSFYLKRLKDNRVTVIIAQLNYNMKLYKYYLLEKIHPVDWNPKTQLAKQGAKYTDGVEFKQRLKEISAKITIAFYKYLNSHEGRRPTLAEFTQILDLAFDKLTVERISKEAERSFWGFSRT